MRLLLALVGSLYARRTPNRVRPDVPQMSHHTIHTPNPDGFPFWPSQSDNWEMLVITT